MKLYKSVEFLWNIGMSIPPYWRLSSDGLVLFNSPIQLRCSRLSCARLSQPNTFTFSWLKVV